MSGGMCRPICWVIAAIVGILAGVLSGWSTIWAIILAIVVFFVLGWLLTKFLCGDAEATSAAHVEPPRATPAPVAAPSPAAEPEPAPTPEPVAEEVASAPVEEAPEESAPAPGGAHWSSAVRSDSGRSGDGQGQTGVQPTAALSEEETLRDGVGAWKYESGARPYRAAGDAQTSTPATAPVGEDYDGDGVIEGVNEGEKPATLDGPRGGVADDLKKIKGVGPKMEAMLNGMGFYHFDQVAAWSDQEVAWVDANLEGFKGRVSRDEWVAQAKLLATGGETAFSKKVDKGGVY